MSDLCSHWLTKKIASGWLVTKMRQLLWFFNANLRCNTEINTNIWPLRNITNPTCWDSVKMCYRRWTRLCSSRDGVHWGTVKDTCRQKSTSELIDWYQFWPTLVPTGQYHSLLCSSIQGLSQKIGILSPPGSTSRQLCCAWDGRRGSWVLSQSRTRQRSAEMWREIRFRWWAERRPVFGAPQEARDRPPVIEKKIYQHKFANGKFLNARLREFLPMFYWAPQLVSFKKVFKIIYVFLADLGLNLFRQVFCNCCALQAICHC